MEGLTPADGFTICSLNSRGIKTKMPEYKTRNVLVWGSAFTLGFNGVALSVDFACHALNPRCDYQFEAVGITATSTDIVVHQQPNLAIKST